MQTTLEFIKRLPIAVAVTVSLVLIGQKMGVASPSFALSASLCVAGLLDFAPPIISIRLPLSLRNIRLWESRGHVYRVMGVMAFGTCLRRLPLRFLNRRVYLKAFPRDVLATRSQLEHAEAVHFWGALVTLPYLALACFQNWWSAVICVVLVDLTTNVYPMLHLRSARARLDQVLRLRHSFHLHQEI